MTFKVLDSLLEHVKTPFLIVLDVDLLHSRVEFFRLLFRWLWFEFIELVFERLEFFLEFLIFLSELGVFEDILFDGFGLLLGLGLVLSVDFINFLSKSNH